MKLDRTLITSSLLAMLPMAASAAVSVDWYEEGSLAPGESVVFNAGTTAYAYNAGSVDPYTINDVAFTGTATGANADFAGEGNVTYAPADNGTNAGFSNLGGDFGTMLDSATWMDGAGSTITLSNLVDGQEYVVQLFSSDTRGTRNQNLDLDLGEAGAFATTIGNGSSGGGGADGLYVLGSFTADATGQASFTLDYVSGSGNANLNAISVSAVPEPSIALLGGLGLLGLIRRRR